jgi:chromosome segregation ATPase
MQSHTETDEHRLRIDVLEQELQARVDELASMQSESHAMSEQLRHVQDELEHYFLAHQQVEEKYKKLDIDFADVSQKLANGKQERDNLTLQSKLLEDQLHQQITELESTHLKNQLAREQLEAELTQVQDELRTKEDDLEKVKQLLSQNLTETEEHRVRIGVLEQELQTRIEELASTQTESQAMSEQLRHVQDELEHYYKAHQKADEKSKDLDEQVQNISQELASSQQKLDESYGRIAALEIEVKHVQEELDHYFMYSREQSDLLNKQKQQHRRAVQLLIRCLSANNSNAGDDLSVYQNLLKGIDQTPAAPEAKLLKVDHL